MKELDIPSYVHGFDASTKKIINALRQNGRMCVDDKRLEINDGEHELVIEKVEAYHRLPEVMIKTPTDKPHHTVFVDDDVIYDLTGRISGEFYPKLTLALGFYIRVDGVLKAVVAYLSDYTYFLQTTKHFYNLAWFDFLWQDTLEFNHRNYDFCLTLFNHGETEIFQQFFSIDPLTDDAPSTPVLFTKNYFQTVLWPKVLKQMETSFLALKMNGFTLSLGLYWLSLGRTPNIDEDSEITAHINVLLKQKQGWTVLARVKLDFTFKATWLSNPTKFQYYSAEFLTYEDWTPVLNKLETAVKQATAELKRMLQIDVFAGYMKLKKIARIEANNISHRAINNGATLYFTQKLTVRFGKFGLEQDHLHLSDEIIIWRFDNDDLAFNVLPVWQVSLALQKKTDLTDLPYRLESAKSFTNVAYTLTTKHLFAKIELKAERKTPWMNPHRIYRRYPLVLGKEYRPLFAKDENVEILYLTLPYDHELNTKWNNVYHIITDDIIFDKEKEAV